jgi:hypothetical protein
LIYEGEHGGFHSKQTKERTDGKKGRRSDQDFTEALVSLAELGLIPWEHIEDETRVVYQWNSYPTMLQGLEARLTYARLDPWAGAPQRPIILCEARTIGGVFSRTIGPEYLVDIAPTGGQCKRFLITKIAPMLNGYDEDLLILYGGDYDDAGSDIEDNSRRILKEYCKNSFDWVRVAITKQGRDLAHLGFGIIESSDGAWLAKSNSIGGRALFQGRVSSEAVFDFRRRVFSALDPARFEQLSPELMLSHQCLCCGKQLTDPASMGRMIGPECSHTSSLLLPGVWRAEPKVA